LDDVHGQSLPGLRARAWRARLRVERAFKAWRKRARVRAWWREGVEVFRRRRQKLMAAAACGAWLRATRRRRRAR